MYFNFRCVTASLKVSNCIFVLGCPMVSQERGFNLRLVGRDRGTFWGIYKQDKRPLTCARRQRKEDLEENHGWWMAARFGSLHNSWCRQCSAEEQPQSGVRALAHWASCYGYWHSTSQVLKSGKKNVAIAFKVMTLAIFLLFLLKVVNRHFSSKL